MVDVQKLAAELVPSLHREMEAGRIPSAAVALVSDDEVIWTWAGGRANIWTQAPADPRTVYLIGSIFKTMSALALLQLVEEGKCGLDDPINRYLDFEMPVADSNAPVTFRHLLTHTSGIGGDLGSVPVWSASAPLPLAEYVRTALQSSGPPLSRVEYSDAGFALIGYLVERLSGVEFRKYIRERIFEPLEMSTLSFEPTPTVEERLAIPYVVDPVNGHHAPAERVKLAAFPAGVVYGSVIDLANWLIFNLNNGVFKQKRLVSETAIEQMFKCQYDQFRGGIEGLWGNASAGFGLAWWLQERDRESYFAHSGSLPGYTAFMLGNRDRKIGFTILTNGNEAHDHLFRLGDLAIDLMKKYLAD